MFPIKTILHPTDFSEHSDYAFRLACSLARDYGGRLMVVHVAEPPMAVAGDGMVMLPTPVYLEPLRERLQRLQPEDPKVPVEHMLIEGDAATSILRLAQEAQYDLIVMGTHGRTGLGRLLMGSVAEQVVRKARCPVLTAKMPLGQSPASEKAAAQMVSAAK